MHRIIAPGDLIAATHNKGKVKELKDLFEPLGFNVTSAIDLDLPEPEETEKTFVGNAILKANAAALATGKPALADDSGLAVTALDGAPGIYSARWAGEPRDFGFAMTRVKEELESKGATDYSAKFVCVLAICWPDGHSEAFEGEVHGHLEFPPRGDKGFGYDPIFIPDGYNQTFGEMEFKLKISIDHRFKAFLKIRKFFI